MKKTAWLFSLVLAAALLAGCGPSAPAASPSPSPVNTQALQQQLDPEGCVSGKQFLWTENDAKTKGSGFTISTQDGDTLYTKDNLSYYGTTARYVMRFAADGTLVYTGYEKAQPFAENQPTEQQLMDFATQTQQLYQDLSALYGAPTAADLQPDGSTVFTEVPSSYADVTLDNLHALIQQGSESTLYYVWTTTHDNTPYSVSLQMQFTGASLQWQLLFYANNDSGD